MFLFTKKVDKPTATAATAAAENIPKFAADMSCCSTTVLWDKLQIFLQRHFTPQDVEKVLIEFQKVCHITIVYVSIFISTPAPKRGPLNKLIDCQSFCHILLFSIIIQNSLELSINLESATC